MTTNVWEGDQHSVSWRVTASDGPVDLSDATVRLLIRASGGELIVLPSTVVGATVSHQLDGTLPVGKYRVNVEVTRTGSTPVTYPDPDSNEQPEFLFVVKSIRT